MERVGIDFRNAPAAGQLVARPGVVVDAEREPDVWPVAMQHLTSGISDQGMAASTIRVLPSPHFELAVSHRSAVDRRLRLSGEEMLSRHAGVASRQISVPPPIAADRIQRVS